MVYYIDRFSYVETTLLYWDIPLDYDVHALCVSGFGLFGFSSRVILTSQNEFGSVSSFYIIKAFVINW